jgi:hypothetical protein
LPTAGEIAFFAICYLVIAKKPAFSIVNPQIEVDFSLVNAYICVNDIFKTSKANQI